MRWFQRVIAAAVPSASAVTATVGASYGQDHVVRAVSADVCRTPPIHRHFRAAMTSADIDS
jgi:precorrin-3B methylase